METSKTATLDLQKRVARLAEKASRRDRRGQIHIDFSEPRRREDDNLERAS